MEVITKDTEEVRAYFEALEEGMRYIDTVTAHFRPAMNGEVYFTGEDVCRMLHITSRTLQGYRTQRLIPYISLPGKTLAGENAASRICCVCWRRTTWTCAQSANGGKVQHKRTGIYIGKCSKGRSTVSGFLPLPCFAWRKVSSRFPEGPVHLFPTLLPVPFLQYAPLHGGEVAGDCTEI